MTPRTENLLREALTLSQCERTELAAELLASLDGAAEESEDVKAAWAVEIERRARRVLQGESTGEDWSAVRNRTGAHLQNR